MAASAAATEQAAPATLAVNDGGDGVGQVPQSPMLQAKSPISASVQEAGSTSGRSAATTPRMQRCQSSDGCPLASPQLPGRAATDAAPLEDACTLCSGETAPVRRSLEGSSDLDAVSPAALDRERSASVQTAIECDSLQVRASSAPDLALECSLSGWEAAAGSARSTADAPPWAIDATCGERRRSGGVLEVHSAVPITESESGGSSAVAGVLPRRESSADVGTGVAGKQGQLDSLSMSSDTFFGASTA